MPVNPLSSCTYTVHLLPCQHRQGKHDHLSLSLLVGFGLFVDRKVASAPIDVAALVVFFMACCRRFTLVESIFIVHSSLMDMLFTRSFLHANTRSASLWVMFCFCEGSTRHNTSSSSLFLAPLSFGSSLFASCCTKQNKKVHRPPSATSSINH